MFKWKLVISPTAIYQHATSNMISFYLANSAVGYLHSVFLLFFTRHTEDKTSLKIEHVTLFVCVDFWFLYFLLYLLPKDVWFWGVFLTSLNKNAVKRRGGYDEKVPTCYNIVVVYVMIINSNHPESLCIAIYYDT